MSHKSRTLRAISECNNQLPTQQSTSSIVTQDSTSIVQWDGLQSLVVSLQSILLAKLAVKQCRFSSDQAVYQKERTMHRWWGFNTLYDLSRSSCFVNPAGQNQFTFGDGRLCAWTYCVVWMSINMETTLNPAWRASCWDLINGFQIKRFDSHTYNWRHQSSDELSASSSAQSVVVIGTS